MSWDEGTTRGIGSNRRSGHLSIEEFGYEGIRDRLGMASLAILRYRKGSPP